MNPLDALRMAVQAYPGGVESLAPRIGKPANTLAKELREASGFKLGMRDALAIAALCSEGDNPHALAYATAVAEACGLHVVSRMSDAASVADVLAGTGEVLREVGEFAQCSVRVASGGNVTANQLRESNREGLEAIEAIQRNMGALERAHFNSRAAAGFPPITGAGE